MSANPNNPSNFNTSVVEANAVLIGSGVNLPIRRN